VPEDEVDRLADELLARVFKPEWMEALRRSDEEESGVTG
jgi:cobalamin biosynthesis Mg chelatase CobN